MVTNRNVWVVTATYNEAQNLPALVEQLLALPSDPGVVVVDNGSPDGTGEVADGLAGAAPDRVVVIHRAGKLETVPKLVEGCSAGRRLSRARSAMIAPATAI